MPAALQELAKSTMLARMMQRSANLQDIVVAPLVADPADPAEDSVPVSDDTPVLQVRGSDAVQMVEVAQVAPALHEPPDLTGLTIALNCCFTAS